MERAIKEIIPHLFDILKECRTSCLDKDQIIHNVYEISEHLGIDLNEIKED